MVTRRTESPSEDRRQQTADHRRKTTDGAGCFCLAACRALFIFFIRWGVKESRLYYAGFLLASIANYFIGRGAGRVPRGDDVGGGHRPPFLVFSSAKLRVSETMKEVFRTLFSATYEGRRRGIPGATT